MRNGKPANGKLVLVVDDDRSVRESLSELLHMEGYAVLEAENGQEALEILENTPHPPCMIVLDCMSSEPFGQVSNGFKRGFGPSELKLWLRMHDAAGVVARWFLAWFFPSA